MTRSLALLALLFLPACYQADIVGGKTDAARSDASQTSSDPCVDSPASFDEMGQPCPEEGLLCAGKATTALGSSMVATAVCMNGFWNYCPTLTSNADSSMPGCPCSNFGEEVCEYESPRNWLLCATLHAGGGQFMERQCQAGSICRSDPDAGISECR